MCLNEYLTDIHTTITEFTHTGVLVSSDVSIDVRTEHIGLLKGVIGFVDGSTLFFKEYLDLRYRLDKTMYAFHYQDAQATLRFRYDNADHKPALGFQDHKHTPAEICSAAIPHLQDVLDEIINTYLIES